MQSDPASQHACGRAAGSASDDSDDGSGGGSSRAEATNGAGWWGETFYRGFVNFDFITLSYPFPLNLLIFLAVVFLHVQSMLLFHVLHFFTVWTSKS